MSACVHGLTGSALCATSVAPTEWRYVHVLSDATRCHTYSGSRRNCVRPMKTIHTILRDDLGRLTQNLVRSELLSERGVTTVAFESGNRIWIESDPAVVGDATLMLIMRRYGMRIEAAGQVPNDQTTNKGIEP